MAKKKNNENDLHGDDSFFSKLAASCKGELLSEIGTEGRDWIDTGNLALNYTLSGNFFGGGVAVGSIIEIYGQSSSGKSLLAMNIMKGVQKKQGIAVYLDAERAIDKNFAIKSSKIDPTRMIVLYPEDLKDCFHKINSVIMKIRQNEKYKDKPICVVVDSIAALPSPQESSELLIDMTEANAAQIKAAGAQITDSPATHSRIISREMRKAVGFAADNNASIIFINQIRQKIGVMYGPTTDTTGGMALKFYCSTRLELKSTNEIKEKGSDSVKGINTKFKLTKSRFTPPRQIVEPVKLMFKSGIDPLGGLLGSLLYAERIKSSGSGVYEILEPWASEGVKFKASKEKGTVPLEVLISNPKLVDANSPEEIQEYISVHGDSIQDGEGEDFEQVQLPEESE